LEKQFLHIGILHGTYVKVQYGGISRFFFLHLKSKTGSVNVSKMLNAGTKFSCCVRNIYTGFSILVVRE
jgi:hypothetical protein